MAVSRNKLSIPKDELRKKIETLRDSRLVNLSTLEAQLGQLQQKAIDEMESNRADLVRDLRALADEFKKGKEFVKGGLTVGHGNVKGGIAINVPTTFRYVHVEHSRLYEQIAGIKRDIELYEADLELLNIVAEDLIPISVEPFNVYFNPHNRYWR